MHSRIAVVGVSALFPGSPHAGSFWSNILAGKDLITDVPPTHWLIEDYYDPDPSAPDKTYCKRGAFLPPVAFDSLEFGIPPSTLQSTDTSQLLALITARQVLDDAAIGQFSKVDRDRISVILGVASGTELLGHMVSRLQRPAWRKGLRESGMAEAEVQKACDQIANQFVPWQESTFPGLLGNVVAGRIANRLDLGGTNCVVDAACASSLSAVSMAVNELYLGQSDLAIVGGVDTINDILMYMCFSKTPALSPTGDCRPFSSKADGTMMGEGLAMLALRRLEDAERDGDAIYAVLEGVGSSSDGKSKSVYAPVSAGQAKALRRAYEQAGYGPETVTLVEAHGTGTIAGDAAEFGGLMQVFDNGARNDRQWCALGSVKSQIGHTKAAAGAAGLFKAVMALHHGVLPPTIKVDEPNPEMKLSSSPFYLNTQARPWIANPNYPRRASVSAFGFGGSNFHVTLQEYTGPALRPKRFRASPEDLFLIAGHTAAAVSAACEAFARKIEDGVPSDLLAQQSREAFDASQHSRLAIVASEDAALLSQLRAAAERTRKAGASDSFEDPGGMYFQQGPASPKVALLFPGQGSQYIGMSGQLAIEFDAVRAVWDNAALSAAANELPLSDVTFPRPAFSDEERAQQEQLLTSTEWAQPALGIASLAYLDLLSLLELEADCMAGHSFGELSALCSAGVLTRKDFLRAASERGRMMKAAAKTPGAMTAIVGSMADVQTWIAKCGTDVVVANANEPQQTVVSGNVAGIEKLEALLSAEGRSFKRLNVATAFHSPVVEGASGDFLNFLKDVELHAGTVPVYSNTQVSPYPVQNADDCRQLLASQISRPVRFVEQVQAMYDSGVRVFVEVGPGSVLSNLTQKCLKGKPHQAIALDRKGAPAVRTLLQGVARLCSAGVRLNLAGLFQEFRAPRQPSQSKPGVTFPLSGVNYGKPYPGYGPGAPKPNSKSAPPLSTVPAVATSPANLAAPMPAHTGMGTPPIVAPVAATQPAAATFLQASPNLQPSQNGHRTMTTNENEVSPQAVQPSSWLSVYLEIQRQTAEAHLVYQRAMMEGHTAYLRTMETFFAGLTGVQVPAMAGNGASLMLSSPAPAAFAAPMAYAPAPMAYAAPTMAYASAPIAAPIPAPVVAQPAPSAPMQSMAAPAAAAPPAPTPSAPAPAAAPPTPAYAPVARASGLSLEDLKSKLLVVVAEKTGYPLEILDLNMDMEADLGIDSIKRVEILAAFRESTPNMPELKGKEMAGLRTLAEVVSFVESSSGSRGLL